MKRNVSAGVVSLFLLLWAVVQLSGTSSAQDPGSQEPAVRPNPAGTVRNQIGGGDADATLRCQGCHAPGRPLPYLGGDLFHKAEHAAYDGSLHAEAIRGGKNGASCLDCHSANGQWDTVFPSVDPRSTVNPVNVAKTCAKCHEQSASTFHNSIHGGAQARGISVAASCSDCHGSHGIFPASDPRSQVSKANTPATCAKCHQAILSDFEASSHGLALKEGDERAPACTSCHTSVSHAAAPRTTREFALETIEQCSSCHEKQAPSYRDTFHGQAAALGFAPAAACSDCHTPHRNLPASDVRSSVHHANLIQTCGRCHEGANASFVTYDPHPEPENRERSMLVWGATTFMEWLFVFVFGFFGLHTLLWLQRSIVGLVRGETRRVRDGERWVVRFNKSNRATHVVVVVSFLILAATGLPLMFYYTGWGQTLARVLGGVELTRLLHRIFAVVTFGYAVYHLGYLLWLLVVKRERGLLFGPDSMVPRPKDAQDLYHMVRWFLYLEKQPPRFDRWTYWEKFDYFAVFWGVPVIGLSGLMLWLPGLFSSFLPGSALNVAMIIHSEEALLATGFIFAFHFFHNHMRPENFPLDTVIFTGKIPLERFEEERPEEYRRLEEEGRLNEVITDPPSPRARTFARVFGFTTYIIGLVLVVAMFTTFVFLR
jgi:cytochrome b subunit of formate dehydrogenase/nitrate/TMAO reductase-like tetraheme cytochrome c subunit